MAAFQKTVLMVAIVFLIISLIFIGHSLYNNKQNATYPPVVADCPDYWLDMSSGDGKRCVNAKNLGTCDKKEMNFSSSFWTNSDGLCHKYKWAKSCNLAWDGVTNATNPCPSS